MATRPAEAPSRRDGRTTGEPAPIRVAVVDIERELPDLSGDGRYESAWVYATRAGRLVGSLDVSLSGRRDVRGHELAERLRDQLGPVWTGGDDGPPEMPEDELPLISVVIATTMSRVADLERCVASLLSLDYPAYEVILVDNRPDGSAERAALHARLSRDARVRVVAEPRPGISAARNHGARVARAGIVAFTDDDAVAHPGWLRAIGTRFAAEPETGCVSGVVLPAELETPAQIWFERSGSKLGQRYTPVSFHNDGSWRRQRFGALRRRRFEVTVAPHGGRAERAFVYRAGTFGMGANIAFRVATLRDLGWFHESLGTGTPAHGAEDIFSIARLLHRGGRITMDPGSIVSHYHRPDLEGSKVQMYGYGVGLTAALTALIASDPRHLIGLAYQALPGLRVLAGKSKARTSTEYPAELSTLERRGMLAGPFAYLRSRLANGRRRGR
jgi:GT2 family glycosyltransferase